MSDEQRKRMGSLWVATDKKGQKYFKGSVNVGDERVPIVAFKNRNKSGETSPDWIMWESRPFEKKTGGRPLPPAPPKEEDWM